MAAEFAQGVFERFAYYGENGRVDRFGFARDGTRSDEGRERVKEDVEVWVSFPHVVCEPR